MPHKAFSWQSRKAKTLSALWPRTVGAASRRDIFNRRHGRARRRGGQRGAHLIRVRIRARVRARVRARARARVRVRVLALGLGLGVGSGLGLGLGAHLLGPDGRASDGAVRDLVRM